MYVGVHSTAQLCHCVASATDAARDLPVVLPVVQEDVGLLPGVVHHLHEVDLAADREVLGVGPQQQQRVVRRVARRRAYPALPPAVALAAAPLHPGGVARRVAGDGQHPVAHAHRGGGAPPVPGVPRAVVDVPRGSEAGAVELLDARRLAPVLLGRGAARVPGGPARCGWAVRAGCAARAGLHVEGHRHSERREQPRDRPLTATIADTDAARLSGRLGRDGGRGAGDQRQREQPTHRRQPPCTAGRQQSHGLPCRRRNRTTRTLGGGGYSGWPSNTLGRRSRPEPVDLREDG